VRGSGWSPLTATSLREVSDYERHEPLCMLVQRRILAVVYILRTLFLGFKSVALNLRKLLA
jgi:hypothetical protein